MSELLEQVNSVRKNREGGSFKTLPSSERPAAQKDDNTTKQASVTVKDKEPIKVTSSSSSVSSKKTASSTSTSASSKFGGMKKGFLFGSSSSTNKPKSAAEKKTGVKTTISSNDNSSKSCVKTSNSSSANCGDVSKTEEDIPLIIPRNYDQEKRDLNTRLKVNDKPFIESKEWCNDDLLKKLEKHPELLRQLADPRIMEVMQKFRTNPQQALKECKKGTEVNQFMVEFSKVMGNHFTALADSAPSEGVSPSTATPMTTATPTILTRDMPGVDMSVRSSTDPNQATADDEAKMREILKDQRVKDAVADPQIQALFGVLKTNPDQAQRMLQHLGPAGKAKVQTLVDAGLLGITS